LIAGFALVISTGVSKADPPDYRFHHYHHRLSTNPLPTTDYIQNAPATRFDSYSLPRPFPGTMPYNNYHTFVWHGAQTHYFYWSPNTNGYGFGNGWTDQTNFPTPYQFVPR
jgi:hypothetical protein